MRIDPNDPRLTAYVLGELDDRERRELEAALEESPEAREALEEIQATVGLISEALRQEPAMTLTPEQIDSVEAAADRSGRGRFHGWYAWSGLAAAASILLVVLVQTHQEPFELTDLSGVTNRTGGGTESVLRVPEVPGAGEGSRPDTVQPLGAAETVQEEDEQVATAAPGKDGTEPLAIEQQVADETARQESRLRGTESERADAAARKLTAPTEIPKDIPPPTAPQKVQVVRLDPNMFTAPTESSKTTGTGAKAGRMIAGEMRASVDAMDYDRPADVAYPPTQFNTEAYDRLVDNPFLQVVNNPLSTFSIDVDTASYSNLRRFLNQGTLPPKDAVRIEELVNYFTYDYPAPAGEHPFSVSIEATAAPWKPEHRLVRIGLKGREIRGETRPPVNLVFLLDVSGSMSPPNKLPLLKQAMKLLVDRLTEKDRVAIAVYAGASGMVLPPTSGDRKEEILAALERLEAGGSTNGGAGIELAYRLAQTHFVQGGINRVILATDGDFNVGVTNQGDLTRTIEEKAKSGVFLSVLGFGMGNYKDSTLEKLADKGNGNYGYIDTLNEARKVLVEQMEGTLITIAKDVKIQIEFNPARVSAYRLIGYENRLMRNEDFNDDTKDAGEIGAGHTVTALYEVVPVGQPIPGGSVDELKYQAPAAPRPAEDASREMLTVKLRYKQPDGDTSRLLEVPFVDTGRTFAEASADLKFASGVASFGMLLRHSEYKGNATFGSVLEISREGIGEDRFGYRQEFVRLVEIASRLAK